MGDYPNSDEEFELMYGDELEVMREQEEDFFDGPPVKSRRSLDFTTQSKGVTRQNAASQQKSPELLQSELPSTSGSFESEFEPLAVSQTEKANETATLEKTIETATERVASNKRTIEELFGEIDDILSEEIVNGTVKKRKSNNHRDDYALIDHIVELRKLAKEHHSSGVVVNRDGTTLNDNHNQQNLSYQVPRYSFVVVTRDDKERVYVRFHSEEFEKEEIKKIAKAGSFAGVMGERFKEIWKEAEGHLNKTLENENGEKDVQHPPTNLADISILKEPATDNNRLWVDLYKPQKYLELLSDESTNRTLLKWLKLWDKVVFHRRPKPKMVKAESEESKSKFQKQELNMNLDGHGCPEQKIVLLCGPPGLGKTTLAHMVARHAGYNVVEVNASDERTAENFKTVLENATQMSSIVDKENRPNCLVFDEIDGAPPASIDYLIKFVNGTATTRKKKGAKQTPRVLKRPIICICNDVYVPALRPLRQLAFVVNFPPTASARLAERLYEIARHQKVKTDVGALLALCEKSGNDIRSCLSVLHFFKSLGKSIKLSDVHKTSIGQKDMQKGLFSVWNDIFQIQRLKHNALAESNPQEKTQSYMNLKNRMQKILNVVNSFGDYERLAQGIFENYVNLTVKDTSLVGTCEALEWFCFSDVTSKQIYTLQNYTLLSYWPYAFVIWHFVFSSHARQKITYPSADYEAKTKALKSSALLTEVMKGMQPSVRAFTYSNSLRLDTLPMLSHIITPAFRPVNLHLYTQEEKEQLHTVISAMIDYNINYIQERTPEGTYVYNIDPNIDEITLFPGTKRDRVLSYSNKQLIAREIEVEKMRRAEIHKIREPQRTATEAPKQLPNHLQKLKAKVVKPKRDANIPGSSDVFAHAAETRGPRYGWVLDVDGFSTFKPADTATGVLGYGHSVIRRGGVITMVAKDFFGRVITKTASTSKAESENKHDIWYQYKEGYNNAVRKRIKISSLM